MDPAQFEEYTAVLETTRTLRHHHEQGKQALIRQTTPCDGTSPAGVRAWFKDIELAGAKVGAENHSEIAARTATGSLRWELERYIAGVLATNDQINVRFNVGSCEGPSADLVPECGRKQCPPRRSGKDPAKCL